VNQLERYLALETCDTACTREEDSRGCTGANRHQEFVLADSVRKVTWLGLRR
jgi:hypothetical protein